MHDSRPRLTMIQLKSVLINLEGMIEEVEAKARDEDDTSWPLYHIHPELLDGLNAAHYILVKLRQTVDIASGH